jgi:Double zinc ribbon
VTEVERFFRRLVSTLAASNPARLQGALLLDDITGSILPYRTHRRALELDTVEDYEAVLLRLCAGEGDLVWTEPEEARKRFVEESRSSNPDLTALYAFENVYLSFRPEPLLWALAPDPRADYAPPATRVEPSPPGPEFSPEEPEPAPASGAESDEPVLVLGAARPEMPPPLEDPDETLTDMVEAVEPPRPTCLYCGGSLPTNRTVNFCPHCGQSQTQILCPECRSEVEPGWRHCVNCGAAVGET